MTFPPRKDVPSLEELCRLATIFINHGVRKIGLTGDEPLVRKNVMSLLGNLSRLLESDGLDKLTLTTNGSLLEELPLGDVGSCPSSSFLSVGVLRNEPAERWSPEPLQESSGGPAKYMCVGETDGKVDFITRLSCDFCSDCNRMRLSCTGDLYTCMGQEGSVSLRDGLSRSDGNERDRTPHQARGFY
ncbi:molybdenum cofactor biosynthesis protein C [Roseibium marinum]|uniref:Molybdenum cofactor biosynthesis protein C n=1 Tax=Roseibium marinum TaxID=281252 RepID=A0A2S3UJ59_9HYPH|nr:hypothetical protein [Roseibium marinum]POF27726.1 molybdenum cofactor biosynthesis protein C [Roseibium marinum]